MKRWVRHLTLLLTMLWLAACSQNEAAPAEVAQVDTPTETSLPIASPTKSPTEEATAAATATLIATASPQPATPTKPPPTATATATPDPPFVHQLNPERPYSQTDVALLESDDKFKFLNSYADW